jgi:small GTP-binding protein
MFIRIVNGSVKAKPYDHTFNIVLAGNTFVGKTNITNRFTNTIYSDVYNKTTGVEFDSKIIRSGNTKIKLQIWEMLGDESFRSSVRFYSSKAIAVLITLDSRQQDSIGQFESWKQQITTWTKEIKEDAFDVKIAVIMNKWNVDTLNEEKIEAPEVNLQRLKSYCEQENLNFYTLNAKTGEGVDELFADLAGKALKEIQKEQPDNTKVNAPAPAPATLAALKTSTAEEKRDPRFDFSKYSCVTFGLFGTEFNLGLKTGATGTHHKGRMDAVSKALQAYKKYPDGTQRMISLLNNQLFLLGGSISNVVSEHDHIDARWTSVIKNSPRNPAESAAYNMLKNLRDELMLEEKPLNDVPLKKMI